MEMEGFMIINPEEEEEETVMTNIQTPPESGGETKKSSSMFDFMAQSKNRVLGSIYNLYTRFPAEPPPFTAEHIWLLGKSFSMTREESNKRKNKSQKSPYPHARRFLEEVYRSFFWFTYRRDFPLIDAYNSTSDIGWGCMLRTGQMILAKTLTIIMFGHDWRVTPEQQRNPYSPYRNMLRWFSDSPQCAHPYSVHNMILVNAKLHGSRKREALTGGEWFSPNKIALTMQSIVNNHHPEGLVMYVPSDGCIYVDKVLELCCSFSIIPAPFIKKANTLQNEKSQQKRRSAEPSSGRKINEIEAQKSTQ